MKKIVALFLLFVLFAATGCATGSWNKNHLKNLTDKQTDWFDRTSEGWRF